ncbi:MAG: class IV adenylate cyclase [Chitinophagaceae bacterium]|nr:class IV adenylate cyclase [Chitinophagaceae bacterium]
MATHLNVEIKATCRQPAEVRRRLLAAGADFKGTDHQTDTYFNVPDGRLKLRQGPIENALIHYQRSNDAAPKGSAVTMTVVPPNSDLKQVLAHALGVLVEVVKEREIYFIDNVKFHLDTVPGLGSFVEIEAIDLHGNFRVLTICTSSVATTCSCWI